MSVIADALVVTDAVLPATVDVRVVISEAKALSPLALAVCSVVIAEALSFTDAVNVVMSEAKAVSAFALVVASLDIAAVLELTVAPTFTTTNLEYYLPVNDNNKFETNSVKILYSLPVNSFTLVNDKDDNIYLVKLASSKKKISQTPQFTNLKTRKFTQENLSDTFDKFKKNIA